MSPDEYCQQKTAASGSSFYYSFLFLPPERRRAITALYAFCREVDDTVDECTDESIARIKLAWWRTEIAAMYAGQQTHPVTQALQPHLQPYALEEKHMQAIIDGMEMDLNQTRYLDYTALQRYCWHVASVVGILSASIFGVTAADLLNARHSEKFEALMKFQVARAQTVYDEAFALLPKEDRRAQRPGLMMSAIYRTLLTEVEADGYHVLSQRISLTPIRKLWLAWKTFVFG